MVSNPVIPKTSIALNVIALTVIVAVLYFTRDVCILFILTILLSFVLSPVVSFLQKWRVPRVPAVLLVMGCLLLALGLCGWLVGGQLAGLAEKLPQYQANVHDKFQSFHTSPGGAMDRLQGTLDSYTNEVESIGADTPAQTSAAPDATPPTTAPAVQAVVPRTTKVAAIERLMLGVLGPLTRLGIVMLLGFLMLIRQEDVRDRVIRLLGGGRVRVATQALDDAGARVSRYLLVQLIINVSFGVCIALGLYVIGVPYSLLWGLLAACLRFVPYFGAPMAAVAPLLMAFAAMPGWIAVILTIILFASLELTIANFLEPWLYGSNTHISPLAIVAAAIFWSWLWGPMGLLLSTPMTVCLVVMGKHVPRLRFLSVILGDEPALEPEARFYQRLLAADQAEAWEIAEEKLRASSLGELFDTMIIPALVLAEEDRHRDELDETREKYIFQSVRDLLEELAERPMAEATPATVPAESAEISARAAISADSEALVPKEAVETGQEAIPCKVVCIPANNEADEMAALMLAQLLIQRGIAAEVVSFKTLAGETLEIVAQSDTRMVCISSVPPRAAVHARYLCKRLRARHPALKIVAGLWHAPKEAVPTAETLPTALADDVVTSLASAVERIAALASLEASRTNVRPALDRAALDTTLVTIQ